VSKSAHREPPAPPQPSTVVAQPATVEAASDDYASRRNATGIHPSSYDAAPHTHGGRS
jgi:hypothetical protein